MTHPESDVLIVGGWRMPALNIVDWGNRCNSKFAKVGIGLLGALLFISVPPAYADGEIDFGSNAPTAIDEAAIRKLLATYTSAVNDGNETRFKALLLNEHISFTGVGSTITSTSRKPFNDEKFADFDQGIFRSGVRYEQSFYNVHILQDGSLGQVSLDFVTKQTISGRGGWGWKVLQLVKVDGEWKIASEFYTGHPLPKP